MNKYLETTIMVSILPAILVWEYYIGYLFAYTFLLISLSEIYDNFFKKSGGEASGGIVVLAIMFVPFSILIAVSIYLNNYEWFKYLEGGVGVFIVASGILHIISDDKR